MNWQFEIYNLRYMIYRDWLLVVIKVIKVIIVEWIYNINTLIIQYMQIC